MAVFTRITTDQATAWTQANFGLPDSAAQTRLSEISEGIENTNYLLTFSHDSINDSDSTLDSDLTLNSDSDSTSKQTRYVLTLFEVWDGKMVEYYAKLMRHLSAHAPVPAPLTPKNNNDTGKTLADKPCLLTPFIEGKSHPQPTADDCYKMGIVAAQLHIAAADFMQYLPNPRGNNWRQKAAKEIIAQQSSSKIPPLSPEALTLLQESLTNDARLMQLPLPVSSCHCDLFRNNVLWHDNEVAGVIDFYFGGDDALIFDLAVCACDWCFDCADENNPQGNFNTARLGALLRGYQSRRPMCDLEIECFPQALQSAALRFWISRMHDLYFPRRAHILAPHDPRHFEFILRQARHLNIVAELITQPEEQTHG